MRKTFLFLTVCVLFLNATAQIKNDTVIIVSYANVKIIIKEYPIFSTDITKLMTGYFAGVRVVTENAQPGIASDIRIRGINSINSSNAPLYVVDGMIFNGDITSINPADIATLTVEKNINYLVSYGSQASNGIVRITTKKGTAGRYPKVDIDVRFGLNFAAQRHETITDPKTYTELGWLGLYTAGIVNGHRPETAINFANDNIFSYNGISPNYNPFDRDGKNLINPVTGKMYNDVGYRYKPEKWSDYLFRTGKKIETNASVSGGSDKIQYFTSFNFLKDEGYYIKSDFQRISARSNLDFQPIKWLSGNLNFNYVYTSANKPGQGDNMNNGFRFVNEIPSIYPVFLRDAEGNKVIDPRTNNWKYDYGDEADYGRSYGYGINPAGTLQFDKDIITAHNLSVNNRWEVEFYKDLKLVANVGFDYYNRKEKVLTNPFYGDAEGIGRINEILNTYIKLENREALQYNKTIANHNLSAFVAYYFSLNTNSYTLGRKSMLYNPYDDEFSNASIIEALEGSTNKSVRSGYSGQIRYNYDEKYFFEANTNFDKNPKFTKANRWFGSWAVGGAWLISRENFMKNSRKWLSKLKINSSYGVIGNDSFNGYVIGVEYKPEKSNVFDAGVEFSIYKDRLNAEIVFYDRKTKNLIMPLYYAPSLGYGSIAANGGSLNNRGVEILLKSRVIKTRNVDLSLRFNLAHNKTQMIEMWKELRWGEMQEVISPLKDYPLDAIFAPKYLGVDKNGLSQWLAYYDANDPTYSGTNQRKYVQNCYYYLHEDSVGGVLKHPNANLIVDTVTNYNNAAYVNTGKRTSPTVYGGFGFDFDCYGFNISATFAYQIGGYGYDVVYAMLMGDNQFGDYAWHKDMLKAWNPLTGNTNTDVPRLTGGLSGTANYANAFSTRFLTSNSALQLANLMIGYDFPQKYIKRIAMSRLNISLSCNNLLLVSKRKGYNPFTFYDGNSRNQYLQGASVMMGLKVNF